MYFYHLTLKTKKEDRISQEQIEFFLENEYKVHSFNTFVVDEIKEKLSSVLVSRKNNFLNIGYVYYSIKLEISNSQDMRLFLKNLCKNHPEILIKVYFAYKNLETLQNIPDKIK